MPWQIAIANVALNGGSVAFDDRVSGLAPALKDIAVKRGEAIDFIVTSRGTSEDDAFRWAPVVHMPGVKRGEEYVWNAQQVFSGPIKEKIQSHPFTAWERLTQALLMSNELIYVN